MKDEDQNMMKLPQSDKELRAKKRSLRRKQQEVTPDDTGTIERQVRTKEQDRKPDGN